MINDAIKTLIDEAVSDYANNHWTSSDFDSDYDRQRYLQEISEGCGWNDEAEDDVIEALEGEVWEDEDGKEHEIDLNDDDVLEYISNAICDEADYYLM